MGRNIFTWNSNFFIKLITIILALGLICLYVNSIVQDKTREGELEIIAKQERTKQLELAKEKQQEELEKEIQKSKDSFFQKLADGFDVNVLILGDSIGEGAGASDKYHNWPILLKDGLKNKYGINATVTNVSMGASTSYAGYFRTMMLDDAIDYDLIIICYGQNDSKENFALYYEAMIRAAKKRYPKASVISILESSQMEYTEKMLIIRKIANHYGIAIADTIAPFSKNYKEYVSESDVIHPNDNGQVVYAQTLIDVIDDRVKQRYGFDDSSVSIMDERVRAFDTFNWYGVEEFKREGNVFTLTTSCSGEILGMDYYWIHGQNFCRILIDGEEYETSSVEYKFSARKRHVMVMNDWVHGESVNANNEIQIIFPEGEVGKSQADGFGGIAVSGYN